MSFVLSKRKEYVFKKQYFENGVEKTATYDTEPLVKDIVSFVLNPEITKETLNQITEKPKNTSNFNNYINLVQKRMETTELYVIAQKSARSFYRPSDDAIMIYGGWYLEKLDFRIYAHTFLHEYAHCLIRCGDFSSTDSLKGHGMKAHCKPFKESLLYYDYKYGLLTEDQFNVLSSSLGSKAWKKAYTFERTYEYKELAIEQAKVDLIVRSELVKKPKKTQNETLLKIAEKLLEGSSEKANINNFKILSLFCINLFPTSEYSIASDQADIPSEVLESKIDYFIEHDDNKKNKKYLQSVIDELGISDRFQVQVVLCQQDKLPKTNRSLIPRKYLQYAIVAKPNKDDFYSKNVSDYSIDGIRFYIYIYNKLVELDKIYKTESFDVETISLSQFSFIFQVVNTYLSSLNDRLRISTFYALDEKDLEILDQNLDQGHRVMYVDSFKRENVYKRATNFVKLKDNKNLLSILNDLNSNKILSMINYTYRSRKSFHRHSFLRVHFLNFNFSFDEINAKKYITLTPDTFTDYESRFDAQSESKVNKFIELINYFQDELLFGDSNVYYEDLLQIINDKKLVESSIQKKPFDITDIGFSPKTYDECSDLILSSEKNIDLSNFFYKWSYSYSPHFGQFSSYYAFEKDEDIRKKFRRDINQIEYDEFYDILYTDNKDWKKDFLPLVFYRRHHYLYNLDENTHLIYHHLSGFLFNKKRVLSNAKKDTIKNYVKKGIPFFRIFKIDYPVTERGEWSDRVIGSEKFSDFFPISDSGDQDFDDLKTQYQDKKNLTSIYLLVFFDGRTIYSDSIILPIFPFLIEQGTYITKDQIKRLKEVSDGTKRLEVVNERIKYPYYMVTEVKDLMSETYDKFIDIIHRLLNKDKELIIHTNENQILRRNFRESYPVSKSKLSRIFASEDHKVEDLLNADVSCFATTRDFNLLEVSNEKFISPQDILQYLHKIEKYPLGHYLKDNPKGTCLVPIQLDDGLYFYYSNGQDEMIVNSIVGWWILYL